MLWRLHLRPSPKNGKTHADVVSYCIQNNIAAIGWPVEPTPQNIEEYIQSARQKYGSRPPSVAFAIKPQPGDFIWARSQAGEYYLGPIDDLDGGWHYSEDPLHLELDIPNQRNCSWIVIGNEEKVPGKIVACFRPSSTFQAIADPLMERYSQWLYTQQNSGSDEQSTIHGSIDMADFFRMIGSDDCEDIVGLYLQKVKGYCLIPSTCKRSTIGYEFILKHNDTGKTAAVQVKQGNVALDESIKGVADHIFLFSTEGIVPAASAEVTVLSIEELFSFVQTNRHILPSRIEYWLNPAHYNLSIEAHRPQDNKPNSLI